MKNFDLLPLLNDNIAEIKDFIKDTDKMLIEEEISVKSTLIDQLLGHYNQLLVRIQDTITKDSLNKHNNIIKEMTNKKKMLEQELDTNKRLVSLNIIYNTLNKAYKDISNNIYNNINIEDNVKDYNNLIMRANDNINKLNSIDISNSIKDELMILYNSINKENIDSLKTFILKTDSIVNNTKIDNFKVKDNYNERVFSLFEKINDQIIDSTFINNNNLVYALYTIEDNSKYYAIIKDKSEIEVLNQSFTNLPNLVLSKDNIIETCKLIIKNAGIYYDINEYMRYIEKSYKTNITKEIDEIILKYKTRLQELENNIKIQLDFIDDISLIVNHKPCNKYPNVTYNDIKVEDYFNYKEEKDSKLQEVKRLIVEVLLNPNVKSSFTTKSILKTLYDEDIINNLLTSNYISNNIKPNLNKEDIISKDINVTNSIKTNYLKIKDYLKDRINELELLSSSPKINVTITRDDNPLFKDINTVLDLHTSIVICDKVYKKGQGDYAVIDYLKTGNTLKFTSKYKARDLVIGVNRDNYLKLLLENIFKRYLYQKDNSDFIESFLSIDSINIKDIIKDLLDNEKILLDTINNFDYDYLDNTSDKEKRVEEILNNRNDLRVVKISKILKEIIDLQKKI